jgi:malonyl-CoA/methylmalonyl-CoA synthetase
MAASPEAAVLRIGGEKALWLTAAEVDRRSRKVVGALRARGVGAGDRVVWQSDAGEHEVLAALGVLRLGATLVPVSAAQTPTERAVVVGDVEPALLIAPASRSDGLEVAHAEAATLEEGDAAEPTAAISPEQLALIIYTSGTTGRPKGAMLTHANLAAGVDALIEAWELVPADRLVSALPLFHVHGLVAALLGLLSAGGSIDLHPRFEVERFLAATSSAESTLAFCVPTMLHRLARDGDLSKLAGLRLVVSGSAPLSAALFREFEERAGVTILERYGMTETLLTISNPLHGERRPGTVGLALPGVRLELPARKEGPAELRVAGPSVFAGYWRRPDATAEVLSDGWLSTGDLVEVDKAGYVVICGRSKELIITGGYNVYPSEVEDALRGRQGIVDVAVVGRPSEEWGEEVVALVVREGPGALHVGELRTELEGELSHYKVPRRYEEVESLPRNALGKLQRHLL